MILRIVAVGRQRERHWQEATSDYLRRLKPYARVEVVEIPEARVPEGASFAEEQAAMDQEGRTILDRLRRHDGPVIALDRMGSSMDSLELSAWLGQRILEGRNEMAWIIGGPLGLSEPVKGRADLVLSFSRLTFPHQMMRPILLEQIYRSFRILRGLPYHK